MIRELCQFERAQQGDFEERILWLLIGEWVCRNLGSFQWPPTSQELGQFLWGGTSRDW